MSDDVTPYTARITSEHAQAPKFMATVAALAQPAADLVAQLHGVTAAYDLDTAVGKQLDVVGAWVGATRHLTTPITGVYFSLDDAVLGLDAAYWLGPFDPTTGLTDLPDEPYRVLLRAAIAANHWDGSIPQAYAIWNTLFWNYGLGVIIQDNGDMTMYQMLTGLAPDVITLALFNTGKLALKPAGVAVTFFTESVVSTPYFGLDVAGTGMAGLDVGAWGIQGGTL
jgi:hypothetical protein